MDVHLYVSSLLLRSMFHVLQGLELSSQDIQVQLSRRRPGQSQLTTAVSIESFLSIMTINLITAEKRKRLSSTPIRFGTRRNIGHANRSSRQK